MDTDDKSPGGIPGRNITKERDCNGSARAGTVQEDRLRRLERRDSVKNGKRPTVAQMELMQKASLDPREWLVTKNLSDSISIVHRQTGQQKVIKKPA